MLKDIAIVVLLLLVASGAVGFLWFMWNATFRG
jgi:hypothetical protein